MGKDNMEKPPFLLMGITAVLVLIFLIMAIINTAKGIVYFMQDGGWAWILVVLGLIVFVALVHNAGRRD